MAEETLCCDVCGEPIAPGEFVGLVRLADERYVVAKIGVLEGECVDFDVYLHGNCLVENGKAVGKLQIGQG